MKEQANALQIAGEQISKQQGRGLELGLWVGRAQGVQIMRAVSDVAIARSIKHIKDNDLYKETGLDWQKFCPQYFGFSAMVANQAIASLESFGKHYFSLTQLVPISPTSYALIAGRVDEDGLEIDGQKVPFTKANVPRLQKAVDEIRRAASAAKREAEAATDKAEKATAERDKARKAAAESHRKLLDALSPILFKDADDHYKAILGIKDQWDKIIRVIIKLEKCELSAENKAQYLAHLEGIYRSLIQVVDEAREAFGNGLNRPDPEDRLALLTWSPDTEGNVIGKKKGWGLE